MLRSENFAEISSSCAQVGLWRYAKKPDIELRFPPGRGVKPPKSVEMAPQRRTLNPEQPDLGPALRSVRPERHGNRQFIDQWTAFRADRLASWSDIKRIDQDPGIS